MEIMYNEDRRVSGAAAAEEGIRRLRQVLAEKKEANIILATGLSQFDMLSVLCTADLPWEKINAFHLDEYVGLSIRHPASFRAVLWKEFASKLPVPLKSFTWIDGESDPADAEAARLDAVIAAHPIDVAFIGIGENGHLAFNDPPADFTTEKPYLVVTLDDACRRQQMGEGWFRTLEDVPAQAISMSVRQILKSRFLIVTCPDERKAEAVRNSVEQPISTVYPASILRAHPCAKLYIDKGAASKLTAVPEPDSVTALPTEPMP